MCFLPSFMSPFTKLSFYLTLIILRRLKFKACIRWNEADAEAYLNFPFLVHFIYL